MTIKEAEASVPVLEVADYSIDKQSIRRSEHGTETVVAIADYQALAEQIERLEVSLEKLEEHGFYIGNACTWCLPRCNPAPEVRTKNIAIQIKEGLVAAVDAAVLPASKVDVGPVYGTVLELDGLMSQVVDACSKLQVARHNAHGFLSEYGTLFRKFGAFVH